MNSSGAAAAWIDGWLVGGARVVCLSHAHGVRKDHERTSPETKSGHKTLNKLLSSRLASTIYDRTKIFALHRHVLSAPSFTPALVPWVSQSHFS